MAGAGRRPCSHRLFVVAQDSSVPCNLIFNLSLKHLFSSRMKSPHADADEEAAPPLLSLPDPVASFKQLDLLYEYMEFAASPSGHVVAAIGHKGKTLIYDAAAGAVSPGPDMHSSMSQAFLVPVGDAAFFAISAYPGVDELAGPQRARFEALQQHPRTGRWAWTAVPDPPCPASAAGGRGRGRARREDLGAYFVSGARVYVSLRRQGTYSYDTVRRRWRTEGEWELPVMDRAVLVPNFLGTGRRLLFGFRHTEGYMAPNEEYPLCAVDMDARPPAVVACWPKAARFCQAWRAGYNQCPRVSQLNYFGGGRFCISVTSHRTREAPGGVVSFMAVDITHDLLLTKRQYSCYVLPQSARRFPADVLAN